MEVSKICPSNTNNHNTFSGINEEVSCYDNFWSYGKESKELQWKIYIYSPLCHLASCESDFKIFK